LLVLSLEVLVEKPNATPSQYPPLTSGYGTMGAGASTNSNAPAFPTPQDATPSYAWICWIALVLSLALGIGGITQVSHGGGPGLHDQFVIGAILLAAGCVGFLVSLIGLAVAQGLDHSRSSAVNHAKVMRETLNDRLQQISVLLELVSEQQLISDTAKSVAFRDKDRETVRRAIHEEMAKQDWEAAMVLADDMEKGFGYKQEAERVRDEIRNHRSEMMRKTISEQLGALDRHIKNEAWGQAFQEGQRVMSMFPNEEAVKQLPQEIEAKRQERKKQLLDSWHDAVARHDVDGSIEILKRLDVYLTPAEAEAMETTARGVFKEKLINLKTQFSLAVQDHKWAEAVRLGDAIMTEFPNTRMAQEVSEKMASLRQRAGAPALAQA
jgi:hypothetical protein